MSFKNAIINILFWGFSSLCFSETELNIQSSRSVLSPSSGSWSILPLELFRESEKPKNLLSSLQNFLKKISSSFQSLNLVKQVSEKAKQAKNQIGEFAELGKLEKDTDDLGKEFEEIARELLEEKIQEQPSEERPKTTEQEPDIQNMPQTINFGGCSSVFLSPQLCDLIKKKDIENAKWFIQTFYNDTERLTKKNSDKETPLIVAARESHPNIVKLLLEYLPKETICCQNDRGNNALMYAALYGDIESVKSIVCHMATCKQDRFALKNKDGNTALMMAMLGLAKTAQVKKGIVLAILHRMTPEQIALRNGASETALSIARYKNEHQPNEESRKVYKLIVNEITAILKWNARKIVFQVQEHGKGKMGSNGAFGVWDIMILTAKFLPFE